MDDGDEDGDVDELQDMVADVWLEWQSLFELLNWSQPNKDQNSTWMLFQKLLI